MGDELSTGEAAKRLGWSDSKVREKHRALGGRKQPNGRWAFPAASVDLVAAQQAREPRSPVGGPRRPSPTSAQHGWLAWLPALAIVGVALLAVLVGLFDGPSAPTRIRPPVSEFTFSVPPAPSPHARCHDGSLSYSVNRQGTCSWHGGVAEWLR